MSDIAAIGGGMVGRSAPVEAGRITVRAGAVGTTDAPGSTGIPATPGRAGSSRGTDRVEVSRMASLLNQLHELPDIRRELVDRVRRQIAEGGYDTPERIDGAIDGLMEEQSH